MNCGTVVSPNMIFKMEDNDTFSSEDRCSKTNSRLRPNVVFFGEQVPNMSIAKKMLYGADSFIVVGTSLNVYPAAELAMYIPSYLRKYLIDPNISAKIKEDCYDYRFVEDKATIGLSKIKNELIDNVEKIKEELLKKK